MPAKTRRTINPKTLDYIVEFGGYRGDSGFTSQAIHALATDRGSCAVLPTYGSRIRQLVRSVDEQSVQLCKVLAEEAVAHLASKVDNLAVDVFIPPATKGQMNVIVSGKRGAVLLAATYEYRVQS